MAQMICNNLSAGYEGRPVLEGLDFEICAGDYLCIVGENGAGKSTLLKTLLGLRPPLRGSVVMGDGLRRNEIGYLPQQTAAQRNFPASVREIVLSGCQGRCGIRPFYSRAEKQLAADAMEEVCIRDLAKKCYGRLSGGQQQRVLLARALCAARRLLMLDEPVSGLDPQAAARMYALIKKRNREQGLTVVMISHDVEIALRDASHVLRLGESRFYGSGAAYRKKFPQDLPELRRKGGGSL